MRTPSIAALVLPTGMGPFVTDAHITWLSGLRTDLGTGATVAQLTRTAFIVGVAVGQLVPGPVGAVLFTVLSVVCAAAPGGPVLVTVRWGVVGRAVVTDTHSGDARRGCSRRWRRSPSSGRSWRRWRAGCCSGSAGGLRGLGSPSTPAL